jgi:hypothetical protein
MISAQLEVLAAGVVARAVAGDSATRVLERARARAAADPQQDVNSRSVLTLFEAGVHVRLGQRDSAVELIEQYLGSQPGERAKLSNSRIFGTLFSDGRLQAPIAARSSSSPAHQIRSDPVADAGAIVGGGQLNRVVSLFHFYAKRHRRYVLASQLVSLAELLFFGIGH